MTKLCNAPANMAKPDDAKGLAHQLTPSEIIPGGAACPNMPILEAYHLWPVPVEHQHAAENVLPDIYRVNTRCCGHNHAAIRAKYAGGRK